MRSLKFIVLFLAVSLIGLASQQALAQIGEPQGTDELATIACNEDVVGLRLTGKSPSSDLVLRNLATQPEARIAAANVVSDRLIALMAAPETRRLRAELSEIAGKGRTPECRQMVNRALVTAYSTDPLSGLDLGPPWLGSKPMKPGDTLSVPVPKDPVGVGFVFIFCVGVPDAGDFKFAVDGTPGSLRCKRRRVAATGAPAKAGQTLTITAVGGNFTVIWLFAEGGRFALSPSGREVIPGVRIPAIPGPKGMGAVIAAAKTFEHRKALIQALSKNVPIMLGRSLDIVKKLLEECVALGKAIDLGVASIPCDAPGRAAIAEEDLTGFYSTFAGERLVYGRPDPDKPFQQDAEEVCQALLDIAIGGKSSELRWAAARAFFDPVRLRREAFFEFLMLCPEKRLLRGKEKDEFIGGNKRKFLDAGARLPFALTGASPELRTAAAASLARPLADLELTEILRKLDGLVDPKLLAEFLKKMTGVGVNPETEPFFTEDALKLMAMSGLCPQRTPADPKAVCGVRLAAGWALGLKWEEWLRTGVRSRHSKLDSSPQREAIEGCSSPLYGPYCFALVHNAPGSTLNWPELAAATVPVMARHFAGKDAILNFFTMPTPLGFNVTLAFNLGNVP